MAFQKPRILTQSEIDTIRGKCLVGHATREEQMQAFGHFDLVVMELQKGLAPFADFYRVAVANKDHLVPNKPVAQVSGLVVTYSDFAKADELVDKY